jgi:hypothetical protein
MALCKCGHDLYKYHDSMTGCCYHTRVYDHESKRIAELRKNPYYFVFEYRDSGLITLDCCCDFLLHNGKEEGE